jgi:hypothetical protein
MRAAKAGGLCLLAGLLSLALGNPAQASLAISSKATNNVSCSAGVCTATAKSAVMNAGDLTSMLASSDVTLVSGSTAKDIESKMAFSWASASRLTLDSYRSIAFDKLVTVAGTGALTLTMNDGGAGGTLSFAAPGRIAIWDLSSSLIINGQSYALVNDIAALAADIASDPSGHYALANNYDATADGSYAHAPIATAFGGTFEGLGNTIANLTVHDRSSGENVALFAALNQPGNINDILLTGLVVTGAKQNSVGGLVAVNSGRLFGDLTKGSVRTGSDGYSGGLVGTNLGSISNCQTAGKVANSSNLGSATGGLAGANASSIDHSSSSATVEGGAAALGGLVGRSNDGTIANSQATGSVTGTMSSDAGGLLGLSPCCNAASAITDSSATGQVFGGIAGGLVGRLENAGDAVTGSRATGSVSSSSHAGGLVGDSYGTIVNSSAAGVVSLASSGIAAGGLVASNLGTISGSFATGSVTGELDQAYVGGLVGSNLHTATTKPVIENSYAAGAATSGDFLGGLVGWNLHGFIRETYEIGAVSSALYVGGAIGYNQTDAGNDSDSYWDTTTSGASNGVGHGNADGVTGLTSTELQSGLPAGFDPAIWAQSPAINGGYPYLIANPPPN